MISARTARIDDNLGRGTDGSNPVPSSEESAANPESRSGCPNLGGHLYDPERHRSHRLLYGGHDPGVCAGKVAAQAHWLLGWPDKASLLDGEALALAERLAHPFSLLDALLFTIMLRIDRGEPALALQQLQSATARSGSAKHPRNAVPPAAC